MFRIKRTRWISLGLVLAVLLLPLPASAGGFWETQGWEGAWLGLLDWLGLAPITVETTCIMIDPNGCPSMGSEDPGSAGSESSAAIDPDGQHPTSQSCAAIDPNGCPGS